MLKIEAFLLSQNLMTDRKKHKINTFIAPTKFKMLILT